MALEIFRFTMSVPLVSYIFVLIFQSVFGAWTGWRVRRNLNSKLVIPLKLFAIEVVDTLDMGYE